MNGDGNPNNQEGWNPVISHDPGEVNFPPSIFRGIAELPANITELFGSDKDKTEQTVYRERVMSGWQIVLAILAMVLFLWLASTNGCAKIYG